MCTARGSVQAVVALFFSSFFSLPALSQSAQFLNLEARSLHPPSLSSSGNPCSSNSHPDLPSARGEGSRSDSPLAPCDRSISSTSTPVTVAAAPCHLTTQGIMPCSASRDFVRDDLSGMGKQGQSILRARDRVLEILQSENACSGWYRTKDADPVATFRTLAFALDREGEIYVRKTAESGGIEFIRNPYVARVLQGEGSNSTVTINANGAFFFPMATAVTDHLEGGPVSFSGSRPIQVGPYPGGTFRAQILTLLHEFGHAIDLLPHDRDDYEGRSRQNSAEVLRFCRAQVESKEAPPAFLASR